MVHVYADREAGVAAKLDYLCIWHRWCQQDEWIPLHKQHGHSQTAQVLYFTLSLIGFSIPCVCVFLYRITSVGEKNGFVCIYSRIIIRKGPAPTHTNFLHETSKNIWFSCYKVYTLLVQRSLCDDSHFVLVILTQSKCICCWRTFTHILWSRELFI